MQNFSKSLALVSLLLISASARAESFNCGDNEWVDEPRMEDGRFKGEVAVECVLTATEGHGVTGLEAYFIGNVEHSTEVHSGPDASEWDGLPSRQYDVTSVAPTGDGNGQISIRSQVNVASDQATRVVYASESTDVEADGNAGFLKQLNITLDVRVDASQTLASGVARQFTVRMVNYLEVKKPWYAPSGIFFKKAKESALDQFESRRREVMPELWRNL